MAQPRGGPLPFGHMSHQIGLDVDIWFMPMPGHVLSKDEREKTSAINLVADDWKHVNPKTWTPAHAAFIRTAAEQPEVERVLVNAAIKKEMCRDAGRQASGLDGQGAPLVRAITTTSMCGWNARPARRIAKSNRRCRATPAAARALDYWFSDKVLHPEASSRAASRHRR